MSKYISIALAVFGLFAFLTLIISFFRAITNFQDPLTWSDENGENDEI